VCVNNISLRIFLFFGRTGLTHVTACEFLHIAETLGPVQVHGEKKKKGEHRTSHNKMTGFSRENLSLFCLTSRKNVHSLMGLGKSDRIFQSTFTNKQISFS
jgi:hypothetical protein